MLLIAISGCGRSASISAPVVHSVTLNWTASVSPEATGYLVYRRVPGSLKFDQLTLAPISAHNYVDLNVQPGQQFGYIVTAVDNEMNQSPATDEMMVTVPQ